MFLHRSSDATALVAELASRLGGTRPDPFVMEVVVTPHPHLRRWLVNELAQRLGRPGEGICAGVSFLTPGRLLHQLGDPGRFWQPRQLTWRLLQVLTEHPDVPELQQLRRHVQASRNGYRVAHRIAGLFHRYLQWRPAMVAGWEAGRHTDENGRQLGFDAWQPVLWRLATADASPIRAQADFVAHLKDSPGSLALPPSVSFMQPDPLSPWWFDVLDALAAHREVHVSLRQLGAARWPAAEGAAAAVRLTRHEQGAHLALASAPTEVLPPASGGAGTLGWLHCALRGDRAQAPTPDGSVQVHGGHGIERQVEILRDAITGLMAADTTLQPRDIVVGCPDLATVAPLVQAAFRLPAGVPGRHPANDFRVQLADRSSAEVNPLIGVLVQTLTLIASRASAADVIDLCAQPAVAQRFGLDADTVERLARLAADSGVRWGLTSQHRGAFGLGDLPQNTWRAGLQRMLLGVALSETHLPMVGTVLPLNDVEDGDLLPVGGLAELVMRLAALASLADTPASLAVWVQRLQGALDDFTLVSGDDVWQRTDALGRLAELAERGAGEGTLSLADITDLVSDEFQRGEARSTFGNGSLTVCSLRSLKGVPYRVVCLVGLDDGVFPRSPERDGDNLMLRDPRPGEPDPPAEDRQALADAIAAAGEALVIVHQSRSAQTNEALPPPAALADLLDVLASAGVREREHPLQPFSQRLFGADGPPVSYDPVGLRGAMAVSAPRRVPARDVAVPPAPPLTELTLDDLIHFVADPVRHFLRERCGLSYWQSEQPSDEIPIELDGLERWAVGDRLLTLVRTGHPIEQAVRAEWLRGSVPPGQLGDRLLTDLAEQVAPIVASLPVNADDPVTHHDIALDCGAVRFTGRVATQRDLVLMATFSQLSPKRVTEVWLRLLALSASSDESWRAMLVGRGGRRQFNAPDRDEAMRLLSLLIRLYRIGLDAPLPLPVNFGVRLAELLRAGKDPMAELRTLQSVYEKDDRARLWRQFYERAEHLLAVPVGGDDLDQPRESVLAFAATRVLWKPLYEHEAVPVS